MDDRAIKRVIIAGAGAAAIPGKLSCAVGGAIAFATLTESENPGIAREAFGRALQAMEKVNAVVITQGAVAETYLVACKNAAIPCLLAKADPSEREIGELSQSLRDLLNKTEEKNGGPVALITSGAEAEALAIAADCVAEKTPCFLTPQFDPALIELRPVAVFCANPETLAGFQIGPTLSYAEYKRVQIKKSPAKDGDL